MKTLVQVFKQLLGRFPRALPVGMDDLNDYCTRLFATYNIPDFASYREAVATMILQMPASKGRISAPSYIAPYKIADAIRKGMVNEVAWNYIQESKAQRQADAQAAQKLLTVATNPDGATDGPKTQGATN